jgi:acetyl esterase/lipase
MPLALPACRITDIPLWGPVEQMPEDVHPVEEIRNIPYYTGLDADGRHHQLDLYLPKGEEEFPVVVLVHGGTWMMGDNRCCGLYSSVGKFLASRGIGVAMPNYRLSPSVRHPEHIKDIARAVAWTHAHIAEHGGRPDQLFLAGHSAGGHLVALLGTDEEYLKSEGLSLADIKGVIAISGVYHLPPGNVNVTLGGTKDEALRIDEVYPLRGDSSEARANLAAFPLGIPLSLNVFQMAFGDDPKQREVASPLTHVRPGLPPFVLFYAEKDLPLLGGMAEEFQAALAEKGCEVHLFKIAARNHHSIVFRAMETADPVARVMVHFIRDHAR